jgi:hypothetical protein
MMGVGPTHTCRGLFKELGILPVPYVYLFSLMVCGQQFGKVSVKFLCVKG